MQPKITANIFEFTSASEAGIFESYIGYIPRLIASNSEYITQNIFQFQSSLYSAIEAFKIVFSMIVTRSDSASLIDCYNDLLKISAPDPEISEIILDSLMDAARYRVSSDEVAANDMKLYKLFEQYEKNSIALFDILDGLINAMMLLYDGASRSADEKKMELIKAAIPVILDHTEEINNIADENYFDIWLVNFISKLKKDLKQIKQSMEARFRLFFHPTELVKIQKLDHAHLQTYLASAAAENPNLKEAKTLLKIILDAEFYLEHISRLINAINVTDEIELEVAKFLANSNLDAMGGMSE